LPRAAERLDTAITDPSDKENGKLDWSILMAGMDPLMNMAPSREPMAMSSAVIEWSVMSADVTVSS
jgi:hypothetical protein